MFFGVSFGESLVLRLQVNLHHSFQHCGAHACVDECQGYNPCSFHAEELFGCWRPQHHLALLCM